MRGLAFFLLLIATSAVTVAGGERLPEPFKKGLETISHKQIAEQVEFLTSAECAGRDTAQPGMDRAAEFLARNLEEYGLEGAGPDGSYFQEFDVSVRTYSDDDHLAVLNDADQEDLKVFAPGLDFVPIRGSRSGEVEGPVVFAGYGITSTDDRYDDFRGIDVKDKVVVVLSHEPRETRRGRAFDGEEYTKHSRAANKARAAEDKGAVALIVFTNPMYHEDLSVLKTEHPRYGTGGGGRRRNREEPPNIPFVHASSEVADTILGPGTLESWQKEIDKKIKPRSREVDGVTVRLKVEMRNTAAKVRNVVARRPGADQEIGDEWVVLGAHYDHVGTDDYGRIFHGADDNGSGTSCLLQVAESLANPEIPMRRSVLFIWFAAEEHGLLGAAAYCKDPLQSLENTVAMLNMDMIGRGRPSDIDAAGLSYSKDFDRIVRKAISETKTRLRVGKEGLNLFKRSDQYEFWKKGVPVLFFTEPGSEFHGDYHQVTDTADKIDHKKIEKIARVVSGMTYLLATQDEKPEAKTGTDG